MHLNEPDIFGVSSVGYPSNRWKTVRDIIGRAESIGAPSNGRSLADGTEGWLSIKGNQAMGLLWSGVLKT